MSLLWILFYEPFSKVLAAIHFKIKTEPGVVPSCLSAIQAPLRSWGGGKPIFIKLADNSTTLTASSLHQSLTLMCPKLRQTKPGSIPSPAMHALVFMPLFLLFCLWEHTLPAWPFKITTLEISLHPSFGLNSISLLKFIPWKKALDWSIKRVAWTNGGVVR